MPGKQAVPVNKGGKPASSKQSQSAAKAPPSRARSSAAQTGERDETYAVISVLYHALQGAETVSKYIEDAREADDEELIEFFEETREQYKQRADEAKELLAARLDLAAADDDEEEDDDEEDDDDIEDEDDED